MSDVQVTVRSYGGAYIARAGRGKNAKTASSTNSAHCAAFAAAEKFLRPFPRGTVLTVTSLEGDDQHGSTFQAHKGGAA